MTAHETGAVAATGTGPATETGTAQWHPPAATSGLRLILVRHGATEATAQRRYSGRGDVPLSALGMAQARAAAGRVADLVRAAGPTGVMVVSSPLARCVATAELIAADVSSPVIVESDLVECDFGVWEGMTFTDVAQQYAAELATWFSSPAVAPPGGESFRDVGTRVGQWVERLRADHPTGVVVAVTHVSPIKLILREALAASEAFLHRCYLSPAGVSMVDFYPDGGVAVRTVNETAHLGEAELPT